MIFLIILAWPVIAITFFVLDLLLSVKAGPTEIEKDLNKGKFKNNKIWLEKGSSYYGSKGVIKEDGWYEL